MPESRKERNPSSVNLGGVSVDPFDTASMESDFGSVGEGTHPIDAGKIRVDIYNEGNYDITVNGDTVEAGQHWQSKAFNDSAAQVTYYTPAIEIIVPANGKASFSWDGPTA